MWEFGGLDVCSWGDGGWNYGEKVDFVSWFCRGKYICTICTTPHITLSTHTLEEINVIMRLKLALSNSSSPGCV